MSKSVFVILGSPRKNGNSEVICNAFIEGSEIAGHTTEKVFLHEKEIHSCRACYACQNTGKCIINDDMNELLDRMIKADVIVLATPVYFYSLSGQLKTMIDRTLPCYTEIANKDFYFVATAADGKSSIERTMDALKGFTDCLPNSKIKGYIYGAGLHNKGEAEQSKYLQKAYEMGKNI